MAVAEGFRAGSRLVFDLGGLVVEARFKYPLLSSRIGEFGEAVEGLIEALRKAGVRADLLVVDISDLDKEEALLLVKGILNGEKVRFTFDAHTMEGAPCEYRELAEAIARLFWVNQSQNYRIIWDAIGDVDRLTILSCDWWRECGLESPSPA